jgi:EAL domain-containing protein (putative c-di-GMP-specific phosphodiesterase class I)
LEILENQNIPKNKDFFKLIHELRKMWFRIALDDIFSEKAWINETLKNLDFFNYQIDIIKIDGKTIHQLYKAYKKNKNNIEIYKIKKSITFIKNKNIKIVAEWIENEELLNFVKDILNIELYQWYLFQ